MAVSYNLPKQRIGPDRTVLPGMAVMGAAVGIAAMMLLFTADFGKSYPYLHLVPWLVGLALVLAAPTAILVYQGKFEYYNPIVLGTWSYFFPAFVAGGLVLAFGWSQPYFLSFIQDAGYNLPYTVCIIALGHASLSVGFLASPGKRLGAKIEAWLPRRDHKPSHLIVPGLCLLTLGIFNSIAALIIGVFGFQKAISFETFDGLVFLTTLFWMQGTFLLWYVIFRQGSVNLSTVLVSALLLAASLAKALLSGNRGGLLGVFMTAGLAFFLAGRRLNFRQTLGAGVLLFVCVIGGMIYGTTFRNIKGAEGAVGVDQYTENIFQTLDSVGSSDPLETLEFGLLSFAERVDTLSSVAVVVSNYESLAPYEESYGLDNNIWKDISTFFIPRVFWPDKPVASEARKYSDLYFDYGENSFAITPIGDLIRNYGVPGVVVGMFLLGVLLRTIYRALVEDQPRMIWRATIFFMLLMAVSYEGFYGLLIPYMSKVAVTAVAGVLIVALVARLFGNRTHPVARPAER